MFNLHGNGPAQAAEREATSGVYAASNSKINTDFPLPLIKSN